MDDQQQYRPYGSYIGRIFAILIAFVLLVLAILFVIRISNERNQTLGERDSTISVADDAADSSKRSISLGLNDDNNFLGGSNDGSNNEQNSNNQESNQSESNDKDGLVAGTQTENETRQNNQANEPASAGRVLSTNTDDLPETGANPLVLMMAPILAYVISKFAVNYSLNRK